MDFSVMVGEGIGCFRVFRIFKKDVLKIIYWIKYKFCLLFLFISFSKKWKEIYIVSFYYYLKDYIVYLCSNFYRLFFFWG